MEKPLDEQRDLGLAYASGAYFLWGLFPLYFVLLSAATPWEIVAARMVTALAFCALLVTITRQWSSIKALLRNPKTRWSSLAGGFFIALNWTLYIVAVTTGHVLEASLGYFMNPLMVVIIGLVVLRERLRVWQLIAVLFATAAVLVIAIGYGSVPWLSLAMAGTWAVYAFIKKKTGEEIPPLQGLTLETLWLFPVGVGLLIWVGMSGQLTWFELGPLHAALMTLSGLVTVIPLVMYAAGARRLDMVTTGMLQFIAPIMIFLIGAFVQHEPMPLSRWIGFGFIWLAVVAFIIDLILSAKRNRSLSPRNRIVPSQ